MSPPWRLPSVRHRALVWVFGELDKRGSFEDYVLALARQAPDAGVQLEFVAGPVCDPNLRAELQAAGARITCLAIAARESVSSFVREMLLRRPSLVHCHFGSPSSVLAPIAWALGARGFVMTDHGSRTVMEEPSALRQFDPRRLRRRFQACFIDRWLPVSDFVAEMLRREVAAPTRRVRTLYNGVDLARAHRATHSGRAVLRTQFGLPETARVVVFVGSLCAEKGVSDLLAVQEALLLADPRAWMVWVGDGPLYDAVQASAGPRVRVLGRRNDVPDLLAAADLLVAPSRWYEAFSLVLAEAAACGVPVVASRIGGIPEVVQDGETGVLITPGDRAALLRAITELLADAALRQRLGAAARRRAEERFGMHYMISETLHEYRRILGHPASVPFAPKGWA